MLRCISQFILFDFLKLFLSLCLQVTSPGPACDLQVTSPAPLTLLITHPSRQSEPNATTPPSLRDITTARRHLFSPRPSEQRYRSIRSQTDWLSASSLRQSNHNSSWGAVNPHPNTCKSLSSTRSSLTITPHWFIIQLGRQRRTLSTSPDDPSCKQGGRGLLWKHGWK